MKVFLDTADIDEIKKTHAMGVLDGVTTNPSLVAKTGKAFGDVARQITTFVRGPVSLEVTGMQWSEMVEQGRALRKYGENVVVKIPATPDGLIAVKHLSSEQIPTNVTLVFQPLQALLAAKAGATFVSPFIGRHDDVSQEGMAIVRDILLMFRNYQLPTQVLVASVRHPVHVVEAARLGAHAVTVPFKVVLQLMQHPLTDVGLQIFLKDSEKTQKIGG
jgi:transaldolase